MQRLLILLQHQIEVDDVVLARDHDAQRRVPIEVGGVDLLVLRVCVQDPPVLPLLVPLPLATVAGELLVDQRLASGRQRRLLNQVDQNEQRREPHRCARAARSGSVCLQLKERHSLMTRIIGRQSCIWHVFFLLDHFLFFF